MLKSVITIIGALAIIQGNTYASDFTGLNLEPAVNSALVESSLEIEADSLFAWEATLEEDEVLVKLLSEEDIQMAFGCHSHGSEDLVCHEEHHGQGTNHYHKSPATTFEFIKKGNQSALNKFKETMLRKGQDLSVMTSYKVWAHEDGHGDEHEAGAEVWTKINYSLNGSNGEIFVLCHVHGNEADFSCHYAKTGEGEPTLEFGDDDHDHDDDNDHNH